MAFDETLAERIREALAPMKDIREVKMMGGLCFMVGGHMAVGIVADELMVRVGSDGYERALTRKHAREMDFTGRPTRGFVFVDRAGLKTTRSLESWIALGTAYVASLPPKPTKSGLGVGRTDRKGRKKA